jgi:hypothetical protein
VRVISASSVASSATGSLRARDLLEVSAGVGDEVAVGEFFGDERGASEAASLVVAVGAGQLADEDFVRVRAHVDDEREQRVAGGEPFEVVGEETRVAVAHATGRPR